MVKDNLLASTFPAAAFKLDTGSRRRHKIQLRPLTTFATLYQAIVKHRDKGYSDLASKGSGTGKTFSCHSHHEIKVKHIEILLANICARI